jgi:uncharacterized protein
LLLQYTGPTGILRVSHRELDQKKSTPEIPHLTHAREQKVKPGTIVPVDIGIWPIGIHFEKGESLMLRVQGFMDQCSEFPRLIEYSPQNLNVGKHFIHFGGGCDSYLRVPVVDIAANAYVLGLQEVILKPSQVTQHHVLNVAMSFSTFNRGLVT